MVVHTCVVGGEILGPWNRNPSSGRRGDWRLCMCLELVFFCRCMEKSSDANIFSYRCLLPARLDACVYGDRSDGMEDSGDSCGGYGCECGVDPGLVVKGSSA